MVVENSIDTILPVKGFQYAAVAAGIKRSGKLDLGLIVSNPPAETSGVFTRNRVVAAPVQLGRERIVHKAKIGAVLVNSGNANACTGEKGLKKAEQCTNIVANCLGLAGEQVIVSSTGVIGVQLNLAPFESSIPNLVDSLSSDGASKLSQAIMTTDAFPKTISAVGSVGGVDYTVTAVAKGAGMIHPNMGTMLAFVMTDAAIDRSAMDDMLTTAVDVSFNRITVDGDSSTNDTVLFMANGAAGNSSISENSHAADEFQSILTDCLKQLARMIVRDGEGSTKVVEIKVTGAATDADAFAVARSIATSSLVKTAFFGEDANWGRIIAAVGYSGAEVDQEKVTISFDDVLVAQNGIVVDDSQSSGDLEERATAILKQSEFTVHVDLGLGEGSDFYLTSDLTYDYVKINAAYRT